jgi:TetR/AcrR family transcriptional regulator, ethionamide resistance regulator
MASDKRQRSRRSRPESSGLRPEPSESSASGAERPASRPKPSASRPRRRRRPEEAEREILRAASRLLAERPSLEVTIGAIMSATSLSRKSFYVYFRDRYDLLRRLVEPLSAERDAIVAELWREGADMAAGGRAALLALAGLYARHGRLLRALAEASSQDREARQAWREFIEPVIEGHAEKIREEVQAGRVTGIEPEPTARALIGMNLQYFFDQLVDEPDPDLEATANTLLTIWQRTLYGPVQG